MNKIITTLLLFVALHSFGQGVQVDTLKVSLSPRFVDLQYERMNYPIVRTGDKRIDFLINNDIKNKLTHNEFPEASIDSTIADWAAEGIVYLDFQVTYNKQGILSLNISTEGCGAYCSSWTEYFNYSTLTGKALDLGDVIDTKGSFRELVLKHKKAQYEQQRKELKKMLLDTESGLDSATYEWALEYYNGCETSSELSSFALHQKHLEIVESCYLPNAIKNLTPVLELKYKYSDINKHLKIKI
ncbi:hypothetical protein [Pontibacter cellulosilyticus]|uniref:DUF4163 domain-containing protein n=1 Tax=Pontibacter cellulosilyticus TaxID=1720253 RepID=A0A923N837_9BACT|nr:hypothetical protein [Pontibacter cellulosilyticus]MBC5994498.1 hypothetical protein [Pontibacter cellulosilyticus]